MKKLLLLLILSFFSAQGFAGSCPDGSDPVRSISADGTYFVYNCGGQEEEAKAAEEDLIEKELAEFEAQLEAELAEERASIFVPDNAYISGSNWFCNAGYTKTGNSCKKNQATETETVDTEQSVEDEIAAFEAELEAELALESKATISPTTEEAAQPSQSETSESIDYIEKLKQIKSLLDAGIINEEDFEKMKQKIIDNI